MGCMMSDSTNDPEGPEAWDPRNWLQGLFARYAASMAKDALALRNRRDDETDVQREVWSMTAAAFFVELVCPLTCPVFRTSPELMQVAVDLLADLDRREDWERHMGDPTANVVMEIRGRLRCWIEARKFEQDRAQATGPPGGSS